MKIDTSPYDYSKAGWYAKHTEPDHDQDFEAYTQIVWVEYAYGEEGKRHCAWWHPIPAGRYTEGGRNGFTWWGPVLGDFESLEALDFFKGPIAIEERK